MKFTVTRRSLLKPLQQVANTLSSRPIYPVLSNLLLRVEDNLLMLMGSDLEVELVTQVALAEENQPGAITVPARKLLDICRGLPEGATIMASLSNNHMQIQSGRSRFLLSTIPADNFPHLNNWQSEVEFFLPQATLKSLIECTQFSMAHQDVRYHLNGMLFETEGETLRCVATDGHRLAVCSANIAQPLPSQSVIVPRKGVLELLRLLEASDDPMKLQIGRNHVRATVSHTRFTAKLVDGRFPDHRLVLPKQANKLLEANGDQLRQAFIRAAILSNEKCRGVRLQLNPGQLKITANNPEQEESEEILDVTYHGEPLEIGFNVSYILDILNALKCEQVRLHLTDAISGTLIEDCNRRQAAYVVMPMHL